MSASEAGARRPLTCLEAEVEPGWVDYNGHMNDAAYAVAFSRATDALMDWLGIDADFRDRRGYTLYTLESHIRYLREAYQGEPLAVDAVLVDRDAKRLHVLMTLRRRDDGAVLATGELMLMGMDSGAGRPAPFPAPIDDRAALLEARHGVEVPPDAAGRAIGIRR